MKRQLVAVIRAAVRALAMNGAEVVFNPSATVKGRSMTVSCKSAATFLTVWRVMPARISFPIGRVTSSPAAVTIQALLDVPSVTMPLSSTCQAS